MKFYTGSSIKLLRVNLFRLYFIKKDIIRGGAKEKSFREGMVIN